MLRGQNLEEKVPNSVFLHTYLSYLKLTKTVERNLLIVENIKPNVVTSRSADDTPVPGKKVYKPQDLARLYDSVIQVGLMIAFQCLLNYRLTHFIKVYVPCL